MLDAASVAAGLAARLAPDFSLAQRAEAAATGARQVLDATAAALHAGDAAAIAGAVATADGAIRRVIGPDNPATAVIAAALTRLGSGGAAPALLGLGGPAGLVAALGIGAFQAMAQGTEHFARWKARVLDLPYAAGLFPPGPVDAAVALSALELSPIFARAFLAPEPAPAARFALAARLALLARQETPAVQEALFQPGRFADAAEFAAGLREFRGRLLDQALDAVDAAPLDLAPAGITGVPPVAQPALREALAAVRQAPEAAAVDRLALLLTGMAANPDLKRQEAMALLRHQLAVAGGGRGGGAMRWLLVPLLLAGCAVSRLEADKAALAAGTMPPSPTAPRPAPARRRSAGRRRRSGPRPAGRSAGWTARCGPFGRRSGRRRRGRCSRAWAMRRWPPWRPGWASRRGMPRPS
ncbi:hypothetical protein ACFQY5_09130 [Paeniroseomonas aquatica]|uniref:hypothetical protein n=1 Tax=Paeniroseomonas aquatica TaxID=373043 RepID=UPI00361B5B6F